MWLQLYRFDAFTSWLFAVKPVAVARRVECGPSVRLDGHTFSYLEKRDNGEGSLSRVKVRGRK